MSLLNVSALYYTRGPSMKMPCFFQDSNVRDSPHTSLYTHSLLYQRPSLKTHHQMFSGFLLFISPYPTILYSYPLSFAEGCHMCPQSCVIHFPPPTSLYTHSLIEHYCMFLQFCVIHYQLLHFTLTPSLNTTNNGFPRLL